MPRQSRIDYPGLFHHVMIRGIEGKKIFRSSKDKDKFLQILTDVHSISKGASIVAWSLTPNHIHILMMTNGMSLANFMRRMLTRYALIFNKKYKRKGPLFQGRYKSIVVDEESYYLELIRYIHLNPFHANMVKTLRELNTYAYTGHSALTGRIKRSFQTIDGVLLNFATTKKRALIKLHEFMLDGINDQKRYDYNGGGIRRSRDLDAALTLQDRFDERVLGGGAFIDKILEESYQKDTKLKKPHKLKELINNECKANNITQDTLLKGVKRKEVTSARQGICIRAVNEYGFNNSEIAKALKINKSSVSRCLSKTLVKQ